MSGRRRGECTNCFLRRDIGWAPGPGCYCADPPRDERGRFTVIIPRRSPLASPQKRKSQ